VEIDVLESRLACEVISATFEIDEHHRHMLTHGLDEIELTLQRGDQIARHEATRPSWMAATTAGTST
jgi:3-isopropylmalate/(R)-2-methylmalate dehydratase small subunit